MPSRSLPPPTMDALRPAVRLAQHRHSFADALRIGVAKGSHASTPRSLSRVMGRSLIRLPGRIEDCVRHRGHGWNDARFADRLGAKRPVLIFSSPRTAHRFRACPDASSRARHNSRRSAAHRARVVQQLFVQRHADALVAPPFTWLVQVSGLMMRPLSCAARYFTTRACPSSVSTSTSAKCAREA